MFSENGSDDTIVSTQTRDKDVTEGGVKEPVVEFRSDRYILENSLSRNEMWGVVVSSSTIIHRQWERSQGNHITMQWMVSQGFITQSPSIKKKLIDFF